MKLGVVSAAGQQNVGALSERRPTKGLPPRGEGVQERLKRNAPYAGSLFPIRGKATNNTSPMAIQAPTSQGAYLTGAGGSGTTDL